MEKLNSQEKKIISILSKKYNFDKLEAINEIIKNRKNEEKKESKKPFGILNKLINEQYNKELKTSKWNNCKFYKLNTLKSNNVGIIGEQFLSECCKQNSIKSNIDGSKTKQKGGGYGDGIIKGKSIEIKMARLGVSNTFQYELGEHPWKTDYIALIGTTPTNIIYLSLIKNFNENYYNSPRRRVTPYFNRAITKRKEGGENAGNFKLTLSEQRCKDSVSSKYSIEIDIHTKFSKIGKYINKIIC